MSFITLFYLIDFITMFYLNCAENVVKHKKGYLTIVTMIFLISRFKFKYCVHIVVQPQQNITHAQADWLLLYKFGNPQSSRSSSEYFLHPCGLHPEVSEKDVRFFFCFWRCNSFALHHKWKPLICWENWCYKMLPSSDAVAHWMHPLHKPLGAYEACALRGFLYIQTG